MVAMSARLENVEFRFPSSGLAEGGEPGANLPQLIPNALNRGPCLACPRPDGHGTRQNYESFIMPAGIRYAGLYARGHPGNPN